jgi:hypothetical protein
MLLAFAERFVMDKHSSLFCPSVNYDQNKLNNTSMCSIYRESYWQTLDYPQFVCDKHSSLFSSDICEEKTFS